MGTEWKKVFKEYSLGILFYASIYKNEDKVVWLLEVHPIRASLNSILAIDEYLD